MQPFRELGISHSIVIVTFTLLWLSSVVAASSVRSKVASLAPYCVVSIFALGASDWSAGPLNPLGAIAVFSAATWVILYASKWQGRARK
jgi:hypothetical protein